MTFKGFVSLSLDGTDFASGLSLQTDRFSEFTAVTVTLRSPIIVSFVTATLSSYWNGEVSAQTQASVFRGVRASKPGMGSMVIETYGENDSDEIDPLWIFSPELPSEASFAHPEQRP